MKARPRALHAALALAALGTCGAACAATDSTRLAVTILPDEGRTVRVRVQAPAGVEPDLIWTGTAQPAPYRLTLAWRGTQLALEGPLPQLPAAGRGALHTMAMHNTATDTRLEMQLDQDVQPRMRRTGDSWVLHLALAPATAAAPMTVPTPAPIPPPAPIPTPAAREAPAPMPMPAPAPRPPPVAVAVAAPRAPAPATFHKPSAPTSELLLVDVNVNAQRQANVAQAERRADGVVLLARSAWTEARLAEPGPATTLSDGTPAIALDAVAGLTYRIDRSSLSLDINAPASAFVGSKVGPQGPVHAPLTRPDPGALLNYDVSVARDPSGIATGGAALEAVAFGSLGSFVTSGLLTVDAGRRRFSRLDSSWRYDMPERMETLVVGDTVGTGGAWSRPVRYAGVRWGRDFGMRPGFVTLPQVSLAGEAALPSTVEVLVNNARRVSEQVAPGPFDLPNVPVITGAGELNLVVRDMLGRETVVKQSYYASPRLLAPGLADFSFEAGWLRSGYGADSAYGDPFASGTLRAGLTPRLTGEGRVELQRDRRAAGVELAGLLGDWAVARAAVAASTGDAHGIQENGHMLQLGVERSTPEGGGALHYQRASQGFAPFGENTGPAALGQRAREQWLASAGGRLWGNFTGGASYVRQTRWDGDITALLGLSLGFPLGRASVSLSVQKRLDGDGAFSAGVNLSLPLENGVFTAARVERDTDGRVVANASASRNAPAGMGLGWRVEASTQVSQRARAGLQYNAAYAELAADAASDADGRTALRAGARGSVGVLAGVPFATRPVGEGGFAVVEVDGIAGVPVKRSNQVVAVTDASGRAFVPGLLPWQNNEIEIDAGDLPMDAEIGESTRQVSPHARSGTLVRFAVRRTRQALLVLHQPDGKPVPVGTTVRLGAQGPAFQVGLRGEVWLTDLLERNALQVRWQGGGCELQVDVPAAADSMPSHVGPLSCGSARQ